MSLKGEDFGEKGLVEAPCRRFASFFRRALCTLVSGPGTRLRNSQRVGISKNLFFTEKKDRFSWPAWSSGALHRIAAKS
jgi:hypothetical protein